MSDSSYLITGATGKTGRRVTRLLTERGSSVRAASRTGSIRFDWQQASTWKPAVSGASAVYLVHPELGTDQAAEQLAAFARVAVDAGVRRAVMVSMASPGAAVDTSPVADAERSIIDTGIEFTVLRPRWFFQNFDEDFLYDAVVAQDLRVPAGANPEGFVDAEDIAAVAVAALTEEGHSGKDYDVTGPALLSFADIAAELSNATGATITYTPLSRDQYIQEQVTAGVPVEFAQVIADAYDHIARGDLAFLTSDVEKVTGRAPATFADYARSAAGRHAWPNLA
ncbi:NAD(P)H-binding protein [Nocardia sp. A7]|uniref:NmrA family NAD(P)-binding protein n=1 Tax=Nocardia sp. A7 TaxID=2789274 RepID=UPI0039796B43